MCAVSNTGDSWNQKFQDFPWMQPSLPSIPMPMYPGPGNPAPMPSIPSPGGVPFPNWTMPPSRQEFEELKAMVLQMKADLIAARAQDIANNEPDCEMEDKVAVLKQIAKIFGISLEEVFPQDK